MLIFKFFVLFGTYIVLHKSLKVLQLSTHLSNLNANDWKRNSSLHSSGCKLIAMLLNNTINLSLIILNIILYYFPFIEYLWVCKILFVSIGLKSTEKIFYTSF